MSTPRSSVCCVGTRSVVEMDRSIRKVSSSDRVGWKEMAVASLNIIHTMTKWQAAGYDISIPGYMVAHQVDWAH